MKTAKTLIENKQERKLHALKDALKMTDEYYRELIDINFSPAKSSKELTFNQAASLISALEKRAIEKGAWTKLKGKKTFEELGNRAGMASPSQLRLIAVLWKDVSVVRDIKGRQKELRSWLQNKFKVSDLRFINCLTAGKVIYALKRIKVIKQQNSPGSAQLRKARG